MMSLFRLVRQSFHGYSAVLLLWLLFFPQLTFVTGTIFRFKGTLKKNCTAIQNKIDAYETIDDVLKYVKTGIASKHELSILWLCLGYDVATGDVRQQIVPTNLGMYQNYASDKLIFGKGWGYIFPNKRIPLWNKLQPMIGNIVWGGKIFYKYNISSSTTITNPPNSNTTVTNTTNTTDTTTTTNTTIPSSMNTTDPSTNTTTIPSSNTTDPSSNATDTSSSNTTNTSSNTTDTLLLNTTDTSSNITNTTDNRSIFAPNPTLTISSMGKKRSVAYLLNAIRPIQQMLFHSEVYESRSMYDNNSCIIFDYRYDRTSPILISPLVTNYLRDEIRQIYWRNRSTYIYIGKFDYYYKQIKAHNGIWNESQYNNRRNYIRLATFILDFRKSKQSFIPQWAPSYFVELNITNTTNRTN